MWTDPFASCVATDVELSAYTTVRVGGRARYFVTPPDSETLGAVLVALHRAGEPHLILGGGSNLLPPDGVIEAAVIHPVKLEGFEVAGERIRVGAGTGLSAIVSLAADHALEGAHVLAGIPGQLGGAIAMNAGGRYGAIAEIVETVDVRCFDGRALSLDNAELRFGYRHADLPEGAVVVGAVLRLRPATDRAALKRETGRILKEKNAAQPTTGWNFGCTFKNPPGESAGKILERAGVKGLTAGGARIAPKHANFIENLGGATAADVMRLIVEAERIVEVRLGIRLEREVRIWGGGASAKGELGGY